MRVNKDAFHKLKVLYQTGHFPDEPLGSTALYLEELGYVEILGLDKDMTVAITESGKSYVEESELGDDRYRRLERQGKINSAVAVLALVIAGLSLLLQALGI